MNIRDLFELGDLEIELQDGFVRERVHPHDSSLVIFNYTEKAQFDRHWTDVTTQCRGLIVDRISGEIISRPWAKFFNLGEGDQSKWALDTPCVVQDKMDGSLGILYPSAHGYAIATRGSFESEQAIHATDVLNRSYLPGGRFVPREGFTYLFEIIYPGNRIVLDYGDVDDLVLLDVLDTATGHSYLFSTGGRGGWPGAVVDQLNVHTLGEAIEMPDRANAEGMVLTYEDGLKLKIKQEDYVRLHKLVTGLNERAVWEHLMAHDGCYDTLLAEIPDEFHEWTRQVADGFLDRYEILQGRAHAAYLDCLDALEIVVDSWGPEVRPVDEWQRMERAAFAQIAKRKADLTPLMFQMLDERDIAPAVWKTLKPKGETNSLMNRTEDVA